MTGTIAVLVLILSAELIVRSGFHPLKTLAAAATGDLVLKNVQ